MRTIELEMVRADGWLDQLGAGSQGFGQLCDVIGRNFVGFSVIAGIRITALTVDPRDHRQSLVEFEIGNSVTPQRLLLSEFRERLASAMLQDDEPFPETLGEGQSSDDLQAFIGYRYVLLAPLYGVRLKELRVPERAAEAEIAITLEGGGPLTLRLADFRQQIRMAIAGELERHRGPEPFSLDLGLVQAAREASEEEDWEKVITLLGDWPSPLAMLLRTAEGQQLTPDVRVAIAEALGLLGTAHTHEGRAEWAQEVLRLGIQWAQDQQEASGQLFKRLGGAYMRENRFGEAIGPLRRSLSLGAARSEVLPWLARCLLERERRVAALVCIEEALSAGADRQAVRETKEAALAITGDAWTRFRSRVPR